MIVYARRCPKCKKESTCSHEHPACQTPGCEDFGKRLLSREERAMEKIAKWGSK
jgi:hypothetical protein